MAEAVTVVRRLLNGGTDHPRWSKLPRDRPEDLSPPGPVTSSSHSHWWQPSPSSSACCSGRRHRRFVGDHFPARWCRSGHFRMESIGNRQAHGADTRHSRGPIRAARSGVGAPGCRDEPPPRGGRGVGEPLDAVDPRRDPRQPCVLIGTVDEVVEDLQMRRERCGISYYVVFEPYLDVFTPVVARLTGK